MNECHPSVKHFQKVHDGNGRNAKQLPPQHAQRETEVCTCTIQQTQSTQWYSAIQPYCTYAARAAMPAALPLLRWMFAHVPWGLRETLYLFAGTVMFLARDHRPDTEHVLLHTFSTTILHHDYMGKN